MGKGEGLCFSSTPPPTETIRGTKPDAPEAVVAVGGAAPVKPVEEAKPPAAPAEKVVEQPSSSEQAAAASPSAPAPGEKAVAAAEPTPEKTADVVMAEATDAPKTRIAIIFYSLYGHVAKLAQAVKSGVEEIPGVEVTLYQVAETLPEEVLTKMHAPAKDTSIPILDPHSLADFDGYLFGFPTRFGTMAAQFKAFLDATGQIWMKGGLVGKPAGMFTSTASQGGGQEVTILTALTYLAHQGMIYVPTGYVTGGGMYDVQVAHGGSPWGAGTLAGADGSRQPIEIELAIAKTQGKQLATVAKKLKTAI